MPDSDTLSFSESEDDGGETVRNDFPPQQKTSGKRSVRPALAPNCRGSKNQQEEAVRNDPPNQESPGNQPVDSDLAQNLQDGMSESRALMLEFRETMRDIPNLIRESVRDYFSGEGEILSTAATDMDFEVDVGAPHVKTPDTGAGSSSIRGHAGGPDPKRDAGAQDSQRDIGAREKQIPTGGNFEDTIASLVKDRGAQSGSSQSGSSKAIAALDEATSSESQTAPAIDDRLARVITNTFLSSAADSQILNSTMKAYYMPENLGKLKVPKMNPEVLIMKKYVDNEDFVQANEKSLYSLHNYESKAAAILANIANHTIQVMDGTVKSDPNLVLKDCISAITIPYWAICQLTQSTKERTISAKC